jgi:hypothetical protein
MSLIPLLARTALVVKIDNVTVQNQDVKLDSIRITWNDENPSTADFVLCRRHDKPDYTLNNTYIQITNKNAVTIEFDGNVFTGKINNIKPVSDQEEIQVTCKGTMRVTQSNIVNLELPSVGQQMDFYHILSWSADISKPVLDYDELDSEGEYVNPSFYKGVKINLGTQSREVNVVPNTWQLLYTEATAPNAFANKKEDFNPIQNYEYFWRIDANPVYNPNLLNVIDVYVGKNEDADKQLDGDLWSPQYFRYLAQRLRENSKEELGYYYVGSAPYEEISGSNGKYIANYLWEDREDGLYQVKHKHWDFTNWARSLANARFNQMKDSNGVAPNSSSFCLNKTDIEITIHALRYYGIGLLTKINIVNTTQENIYKNVNGFPVRPKTITLDFGTMRASLNCDNLLTNKEKRTIEDNLGDEPVATEEVAIKKFQKYDINRQADIV